MSRWASLLLAGLAATLCSCQPASRPPVTPLSAQKSYQVKGVVIDLSPQSKEVKIRHEEVPGFMPAMTMPFDVKDARLIEGLKPGDRVSFRLNVTETDGWIDEIQKINDPISIPRPPSNGIPSNAPFRLVRDVEPLTVGDLLPPYPFTNQFGQPFKTSDFQGSALAITFLFTRCPFPTFCPAMANDFEETQQKLLALPSGPSNWHLLTISFDPEFDKPAILKGYAERYHYDSNRWTFATGDLIEITAIAEQLGLTFWHDETGSISHNLRTAVFDASGRLQKVFTGNKWTSDELVSEMTQAASKKQNPPTSAPAH
jgi:Uncharacterized protein SCO1/SenC/PrrC, involved in biogenesis of respiratory and photosynthetic systems